MRDECKGLFNCRPHLLSFEIVGRSTVAQLLAPKCTPRAHESTHPHSEDVTPNLNRSFEPQKASLTCETNHAKQRTGLP